VQTIQIVVDEKLLKAADATAKKRKVNRSALIRQALIEHLKRDRILELEEQDRRAYIAVPQQVEEFKVWEDIAAWPD
jgi:metal-responsive CopG/Arc/MetJ family transcriptional regulator